MVALGWLGTATAGPADSSGFKCPTTGRIISVGTSAYQVRTRCREPDDVAEHRESRIVRVRVVRWAGGQAHEVWEERAVEVMVEDWTYDFGRNRFLRLLRFENGQLVAVRDGDKGRKDPE
jgi:hypothetical protein